MALLSLTPVELLFLKKNICSCDLIFEKMLNISILNTNTWIGIIKSLGSPCNNKYTAMAAILNLITPTPPQLKMIMIILYLLQFWKCGYFQKHIHVFKHVHIHSFLIPNTGPSLLFC